MSIEKFVEEQIRKAMEAGEFDNLPGKGKPVDLTGYFNTPEDLRMTYSILKSNNFVPEGVELLKEIEALKKQIDVSSDEVQRQILKKKVIEKSLVLSTLLEGRSRKR